MVFDAHRKIFFKNIYLECLSGSPSTTLLCLGKFRAKVIYHEVFQIKIFFYSVTTPIKATWQNSVRIDKWSKPWKYLLSIREMYWPITCSGVL